MKVPWWTEVLKKAQPEWLEQIRKDAIECEARRAKADYNTGTISESAALCLRTVCEKYQPKVIIEIGTFIGTSALAMLGCKSVKVLYSCDKMNSCGPTHPKLRGFRCGSTRMLEDLVRKAVVADLFFIDGRLEDADVRLMDALSTAATVFALDDFESHEKGVVNYEKMRGAFKRHTLMAPPAGLDSSIAVLVP